MLNVLTVSVKSREIGNSQDIYVPILCYHPPPPPPLEGHIAGGRRWRNTTSASLALTGAVLPSLHHALLWLLDFPWCLTFTATYLTTYTQPAWSCLIFCYLFGRLIHVGIDFSFPRFIVNERRTSSSSSPSSSSQSSLNVSTVRKNDVFYWFEIGVATREIWRLFVRAKLIID